MAASQPGVYDEKFAKVLVKELPQTPKGSVQIIPSTMSVLDALLFLHKNEILSAPVRDVEVPDAAPWSKKFIRTVDMIRLCVVIACSFEPKHMAHLPTTPEEDESRSESRQFQTDHLPKSIITKTVTELTPEEGVFEFLPIEDTATLLDAIVLLGTLQIKRLPVLSGNEIVNVVSQSSLVHLLAQNIAQYDKIVGKSLESLGLAKQATVYSVRSDQQVVEAFKLLRDQNVSGVPVLGVNKEVIGCISANMAYFVITSRNKQHMLSMHAAAFLRVVADMEEKWNLRSAAITCKPSDPLGNVIVRMDAARIHRIFVVDENGHLIRSVSLCDALAVFVKEPEGECVIL